VKPNFCQQQWGTQEFCSGGVQQIQLRTEGRENWDLGDLGAVAPYSGVPLCLQMSEAHILIRLLRMYFPRNWEFGSALSKLRKLGGGGLNTPTPLGTPLVNKNQVALKSDKNNRYCVWRRFTFVIISHWIIVRMRNVSDRFVEKIKITHFVLNNFVQIIVPFMR
jgi:hypothetical protein